jgi:hypothetical protein
MKSLPDECLLQYQKSLASFITASNALRLSPVKRRRAGL